jgi:hypothetical protein
VKTALILFISFGAISCAQEKKPDALKRLESVTWDLKNHKLVWVVQKGSEVNGKFVASSEDRYEISPDDAIMAFSEEKRGFTEQEAASLHKLLDTLSLYCAESVVWWDQGEGEKIQDGVRPRKHTPDEKPTDRIEEPHQKTPPPPVVNRVAALNMVFGDKAERAMVAQAQR